MVAKTQQLATILKQQHYSLTRTREAVFAVLEQSGPLTMHQLTTSLPDVDRSTVYRTVELFEQLGIAHRIQIGWKYKVELSDAFSHHHHHLACANCGAITALPENTVLEAAIQSLGKEHGFTITDHQLEIQGLCQNCSPTQVAE